MNHIRYSLILVALVLALSACGGDSGSHSDHGHVHDDHAHDDHAHAEADRGPHGGRLLSQGNFVLELTIFETGTEPHFRAYPSLDGKALPSDQVELRVDLRRINGLPDGQLDPQEFSPEGAYLRGRSVVVEPHSYTARVRATHAGKTYEWNFDSPEDQVQIEASMARSSDVETGSAIAGTIRETLTLTGRTEPNAERVRVVRARYPGTVKSVSVETGDTVTAGQTLARIESDDSLQTYAVTAPIGGTIIKRSTNPGESSGTDALFEIIDSRTLWANLAAFPSDRNKLKSGQSVAVIAADGSAKTQGKIALISSSVTGPTSTVRVVIDNKDSRWTPGQFLNAEVTINEKPAAITVPVAALQRMRGNDVVFLVDGDRYQAQPVKIGRRDSERVEILSGLSLGARIVTNNSFLIKADIEKSGAAHDH